MPRGVGVTRSSITHKSPQGRGNSGHGDDGIVVQEVVCCLVVVCEM